MDSPDQPSIYRTQASLLARLHTLSDREAWALFHEQYWRLIVGYARRRGCRDEMAWDVLQETMLAFMHRMRSFTYDPDKGSFRAYLLGTVSHQIASAFRREHKYVHVADEETEAFLAQKMVQAAEPSIPDWDREWEDNILAQAIERVKLRVMPLTFVSFQRYVLDGWPVERVEAELGLSRNAVYQHRNRVITMIRQEARTIAEEMAK